MIEFDDKEQNIFEEMMKVVERYPGFNKYKVKIGSVLNFPGLEINLDHRKVYYYKREVSLTAKEFDILCFLAANCGRVMTYAQIYRQVWGEYVQDIENNTIGYHICHLKEKLFLSTACPSFNIRCVRSVGYCFELLPGRGAV